MPILVILNDDMGRAIAVASQGKDIKLCTIAIRIVPHCQCPMWYCTVHTQCLPQHSYSCTSLLPGESTTGKIGKSAGFCNKESMELRKRAIGADTLGGDADKIYIS